MDPPSRRASFFGGIYRPHLPRSQWGIQVGFGDLPRCLADPLRHFSALPPFLLVAAMGNSLESPRSFQHLPAHRRHLHSPFGRSAPSRPSGHNLVNRLGRRACRDPAQSLLANRSQVARNAYLRCFGVGCSVVPPAILGARGTGRGLASFSWRNLVHDRRDRLRNKETRFIASMVRVPRDLPYLYGSCVGVPLYRRVFDSFVNFPQIAQNPHFQAEGCYAGKSIESM